MTAVYADPGAAPPALGPVGVPTDDQDRQRLVLRVQATAAVPAVICLGAHWIFLISYWIPETSAFPAHDWWLTQLSPLVSETATSAGRPQVDAQRQQPGVFGDLLLVLALVLLLLARHPRRLGQGAVLVPAAIGTLVAVVALVTLLGSGSARSSAVAILLIVAWVAAAAYVSFFSLLLDLGGTRPRSWRNGLVLLAAYAVVGPAPTAVGRALFAPGLREAAALLQDNTVALRLAALTNGATVLLYLAGLGVGVAVWAAYQCWPLRRDTRTLLGVGVLVASVTLTAGLGGAAAAAAGPRADQLRLQSPAQTGRLGCASVPLAAGPGLRSPGAAARTLAVTGLGCRSVTTFVGYRQLGTRAVGFSMAPLTARLPNGDRIAGRLVSAEYGGVVVLAGTRRLDTSPDQLAGFAAEDATLRWQFSCPGRDTLRVRFAQVPGGEQPRRGHVTAGETRPQVVARCGGGRTVRLDPATGSRVRR